MDLNQKTELERLRLLKKVKDLEYLEKEREEQELDELNFLRENTKLKQFNDLQQTDEILRKLVDLEKLKIIEELKEYEIEKELKGLVNFYNQLGFVAKYGKGDTDENNEWLRWIHNRYFERFLKDNDRIWTVTSIFIPLSLAGLSSVKEGTFESVSLLAVASIGLISFWYLICEKHRAFQEQSIALVQAIEKFIGIDTKQVETIGPLHGSDKNWLIQFSHFFIKILGIKVQRARAIMLYLVIVLWSFAIYWSLHKSNNNDLNPIVNNKTIINDNINKDD